MTQAKTAIRPLRGMLAETRLLAFLPLFIVLAWWTGEAAVLFVVSFMFPMLLALQELMRPRDVAPAGAGSIPDRGSHVAAGRGAALAHLAALVERTHQSGNTVALLLLDIDDFRNINLRHGMAAGDAVLAETEARLRAVSRPADRVFCMGGDRFAVIPAPMPQARTEAPGTLAERLQAALARPVTVAGAALQLGASVGLCLSERAPENSAEAMLEAAEAALAEARRAGPGKVRSFTPRMRRLIRLTRMLATETEAALSNGQIRPWFQPQVCTDTGVVSGFEALARWQHPEHGLLEPGTFLPALMAAGQAARLGETVLHHALSALRGWDGAGLAVATVSVNFSTDELRDPGLCERLKWEMDRFDLSPARLVIELTETAIGAPQASPVADNIRGLAGFGFGIDLDDFGTGTASILNLRRYPVRRIKIDRTLLAGIEESPEQQHLVTAVLRLAESLDIDVLAEGIETPAAQSLLAQLGCRYIQGFGLARPMPYDATLPWLHEHGAAIRGATLHPGRRTG